MKLPTYKELLNNRVHIGHFTKHWHPNFAPFILAKKGKIHIINLQKTVEMMELAGLKMKEIIEGGDKILFISVKKQAKSSLTNLAESIECPHMLVRWVGGTLTNFRVIRKALKGLEKMSEISSNPSYKHLTKKEILSIERKKDKLEKNLGGVTGIHKLPKAVFIIDIRAAHTALLEARSLGITTIAMVDSNSNPQLVDYPIYANDDSKKSINLITSYMKDILQPSFEKYKKTKRQSGSSFESTDKSQKSDAQKSRNKEEKASTKPEKVDSIIKPDKPIKAEKKSPPKKEVEKKEAEKKEEPKKEEPKKEEPKKIIESNDKTLKKENLKESKKDTLPSTDEGNPIK